MRTDAHPSVPIGLLRASALDLCFSEVTRQRLYQRRLQASSGEMRRLLLARHGNFGYSSAGSLATRAPALPALCDGAVPRYYSAEKHDATHTLGGIGEKARSTAEEFLRVAKEKTDEVSESAKETLHETKEAATGESQENKEAFKKRVEEGRYDHQK